MTRMRLNSSYWVATLFTFSLATLSSPIKANESEIGRVNITGSIVSPPCTIELDTPDQTLDIGNDSVSRIIRESEGPRHYFSIHLSGCTIEENDGRRGEINSFRTMFEAEEYVGHFKHLGSAKGVVFMIRDNDDNIASPGIHLPNQLPENDMHFKYSLNLAGNQEIIKPGNVQLILRFRIDYN